LHIFISVFPHGKENEKPTSVQVGFFYHTALNFFSRQLPALLASGFELHYYVTAFTCQAEYPPY
jgi:hypothetical protein